VAPPPALEAGPSAVWLLRNNLLKCIMILHVFGHRLVTGPAGGESPGGRIVARGTEPRPANTAEKS